MRIDASSKGLLVAGVVLLAIGLERFLNAYLLRGQDDLTTRLVIGIAATIAAAVLFALVARAGFRSRR